MLAIESSNRRVTSLAERTMSTPAARSNAHGFRDQLELPKHFRLLCC